MKLIASDPVVLGPAPTLVVPALSIGNVGQLGADLLIHSLKLSRIAYLDSPLVLPCVGNDPFSPEAEGNLTVALEVFGGAGTLKVVQQRSPVLKGKMLQFAESLATLAKENGVKEVIILSGIDMGRHDRRTSSSQLQYISSANEDGTDARCEQLGWRKLAEYSPNAAEWRLDVRLPAGSQVSAKLIDDPTHFAKMPFNALLCAAQARGVKVVCLLMPCSEGDNTPDAFALAEAVTRLASLDTKAAGFENIDWRIPSSWTTVYGPPPDSSIYC